MPQQSDRIDLEPGVAYEGALKRIEQAKAENGSFILATNEGLYLRGNTAGLAVMTQKLINEINKMCLAEYNLDFNQVIQHEFKRLENKVPDQAVPDNRQANRAARRAADKGKS